MSAISRRYDTEINKIDDVIDAIEAQNDALQTQLDDYDSILSVVDSVYAAEIERIQAEQDAIDDIISGLQDENDERQLALDLEQARWDLYKAQTQRTQKIFNGTEFIYTTNQEDIREAQENLAELELEQVVNGLEKERDALDSTIEELEKYRDLWAEITDVYTTEQNEQLAILRWGNNYQSIILANRLTDIETFKDSYVSVQKQMADNELEIESLEEKKEIYSDLKEQWAEITDVYESSIEDQLAVQVLGANWESDILSGRIDVLNNFKNQYISTQQAIADAAWNSANEQIKAAQEAEKAASGTTNSAGNVGNTSSTSTSAVNTTTNSNSSSNATTSSSNATWGVLNASTKMVIRGGFSDASSAASWASSNGYSISSADNANHAIMVKPKNVTTKYASGTSNAKRGLNLVGEDGTETYIDNDGNISLVTEPTLIPMKGGETVKNAAETKSLLDTDSFVPVDTFKFTGIDGKTIHFNADEFWQKWKQNMPDYSSMVQLPNMQLPQYDFAMTRNETTPVVQNITLSLPNVTNNSGYERIKKELRQMQIDAYQIAHKR